MWAIALNVILLVFKGIKTVLIGFFKWLFSGEDSNKSRRTVLAVVLLLSIVTNLSLTWQSIGKADVIPKQPKNTWNFKKIKPNAPTASSPITITIKELIYIDKDGSKTVVKHPIEGSVMIGLNGDIHVQRMGLCLVPILGITASDSESVHPLLGARFAYWNQWGLEGWASTKRLGIGPDRRLGEIGCSNFILSIGPSFMYKGGIGGYVSLSAATDVLHFKKGK